ncbi:MAG TPA: 50S ribosomal protein L6, partial [Flavobacteriales bacterium]|nr:50S ribosomal protein L6 [Flavobacteriales bacterium]
MSRIGYAPISIPNGVEVSISEGVVKVKGPKGELEQKIDDVVEIKKGETEITCERKSEDKEAKSKHGLYRSLINNMVIGVSQGWKKEMELVGVGYRATVNGQLLELSLGKSHLTVLGLPKEIKASAVTERGKNPIVTMECCDKQLIGQVAAKIRSLRKPEPYKGKG